jgi:hypothetical protein
MDAVNSSELAETDCTFALACSAAIAMVEARSDVCSAVADIASAVPRSCPAADDTASMTCLTLASKRSAISIVAWRRSVRVRSSSWWRSTPSSCSRRCASVMPASARSLATSSWER